MNGSPRFPRAGGALLAGSIVLGVVFGIAAQESSIGFLAGLAVGLALLGAVWLMEQRRGR
jgi:hypothetical protein